MKMKTHILKMAAMFLIALLLFSTVTMLLWNALMPVIFSLPVISFFQAAGLLVLARIIFGFGFRHHHPHEHMHKLHNMSPEEKREFIRSRHLFYHCRSEHKESDDNQ